jgi:hypothetical protein
VLFSDRHGQAFGGTEQAGFEGLGDAALRIPDGLVGHEDAGKNLAIGYTLVATCEQHGVSPIDYLTDVLTRVQKALRCPGD